MKPSLKSDVRTHRSTSFTSIVSFLASLLRGFERIAWSAYRVAKWIDTEMGRILEVGRLRTHSKSQALSLIGSGAIIVCSFAPVVNAPVVGAVTYFNANSDLARSGGILLVILGLVSLSVALIERYVWLYLVGFCALSISFSTLLSWKWYLARPGDTPSAGLFDYFTQSASKEIAGRSSLSFGFLLLIYGAVLVMLAALLRPRAADALTLESLPD